MKEITPVEHELKSKIEYATKEGGIEQAQILVLHPPTSKQLKYCCDLKQAFFRAMPQDSSGNDQKEIDDADEIELDADQIMMLLAASNDVNLASVLVTASELLTSPGMCFVDGEVKLTKPLLNQLDIDELEEVVGKYLVNFTLASALKKMKEQFLKKSST